MIIIKKNTRKLNELIKKQDNNYIENYLICIPPDVRKIQLIKFHDIVESDKSCALNGSFYNKVRWQFENRKKNHD